MNPTNPTPTPEGTPRTGLPTDDGMIRDFQPPDEIYAAAKLLTNYFASEGFSSGWSFMGISCRDRADRLETRNAELAAEVERWKAWAKYACERFTAATGQDLQAQAS